MSGGPGKKHMHTTFANHTYETIYCEYMSVTDQVEQR